MWRLALCKPVFSIVCSHTTWMEVALDERVSGEEILSLFGRFEPLHLPFSTSCRPMRVFRPYVAAATTPKW